MVQCESGLGGHSGLSADGVLGVLMCQYVGTAQAEW